MDRLTRLYYSLIITHDGIWLHIYLLISPSIKADAVLLQTPCPYVIPMQIKQIELNPDSEIEWLPLLPATSLNRRQ